MSSTTLSQVRVAMRDKYYNEHCELQEAAMQAGLDLLPDFADRHQLVVIDYGCSQGNNSIEPLKKVISTLPEGATASLVFEDTPFNDFSTLAQTVAQHFSAGSLDNDRVRIAPSLVPIGFYQQVVPDGHADLGLSWSSLNYLSKVPQVELDATAPPAEFAVARHKAFSAAAHPDLITLLKLRAKEIREGGYLVTALGGRKPAGETEDANMGVQALQGGMIRMIKEGALTMAELGQMALFPSHERSPDEIRAALEDPEVKALWELEILDPKLIVHPAWATYQAAAENADAGNKEKAYRKYATETMTNMYSSSGWYYIDVLKKTRGTDFDADAVIDKLTQYAVEDCVANHPDMKMAQWYNYIRLKRTSQKA